ncbi:MAG TPA: cbb3-type cytochrome c oxidase subunit I, partial [Clostridia bacterium]|nr:cbb3-type cytochrome c oxidase subunit I [Clostridia bacterium]
MSNESKPSVSRVAGLGAGLSPHAPSILLPLRFMVTGLLALFAGVTMLVLRPDILATYHYNQYVVAVTHLFVLGWISTIVMGAMYQLVPVALETKLYSERLARWQFVLHLVGWTGMVWMFWTWNMKQVGHFGSVLALGVGLFAYNIFRTLLRVPRWNFIATSVASALAWLSFTVLVGLTIAAGKSSFESESSPAANTVVGALVEAVRSIGTLASRFDAIGAMHAHAHSGAVGVFLMLIVGISYKLVPMFTLSEVQSPWRARISIVLLNVGLLGSFAAILNRSVLKPVCALVVIAGLVLYGVEIAAILRARKRRALDWGIKYFLTAIGLLVPISILALVLSWPSLPLTAFTGQLENLYGFLALLGVVSFAIIGMLYKILPFLVWYGTYSSRIGLNKVPSLADLYSPGLQTLGYWTYVSGLVATSVATVLSHQV